MAFKTQPSPRRGSVRLTSTVLIFATLAIGIVIGSFVSHDAGAADEQEKAAPDATPLTVPDPVPAGNQFTPIVEQVSPSVVNIRVEQFRRETASSGERGEGGDDRMEDFFRRFFGMPGAPEGFRGQPAPRPRPGEGSGVIVDAKGYIITNNHVVADADRVRVRFANGGESDLFDAEVIGTDVETDIAVIKVDAPGHKLTAAKIGNSDAVRVGDWAIAIGSPFGFRESVTVGIISALDRQVQNASRRVQSSFQRFFQTDAAINPGNSGGPLVNIRGEVIGINTAIVSRTGGNEGLGFSLPSNQAVDVYNQIIQYGRVARGSIGITFQSEQNPALLRSYGAKDGGVMVSSVVPGGPADRAGMEEEDIIIRIDGKSVPDGDALIDIVAATPVGSTVPIEIVRDGDPTTLDVKIADRAELFAEELGLAQGDEEPQEEAAAEVDLGISVQNLTTARREQLEFEDDGVVILDVEPASFAEDIGLVENDIVVAINRRPVGSVSDVREIRDSLEPGDDVAFKVMRRGPAGWTAQYLAGVLPEGDEGQF